MGREDLPLDVQPCSQPKHFDVVSEDIFEIGASSNSICLNTGEIKATLNQKEFATVLMNVLLCNPLTSDAVCAEPEEAELWLKNHVFSYNYQANFLDLDDVDNPHKAIVQSSQILTLSSEVLLSEQISLAQTKATVDSRYF